MNQSDSHSSLINEVILHLDNTLFPDRTLWQTIFNDCHKISITQEFTTKVDARLVSVTRCEPYGCRSGSTDDTIGVMVVYDTWAFEAPHINESRFLIANAVWRVDPPLPEAIATRMDILADTLQAFNATTSNPIQSLLIHCDVLGFWKNASTAEQEQGMQLIKTKLQEHGMC